MNESIEIYPPHPQLQTMDTAITDKLDVLTAMVEELSLSALTEG